MVFSSNKKNKEAIYPCIDNQPIPTVGTTKFLGVCIDENLMWDKHLDNMSKKIKTRLGLVRLRLGSLYCTACFSIFSGKTSKDNECSTSLIACNLPTIQRRI